MEHTAAASKSRLIALDLAALFLLAAVTGVATGIALAGITLLIASPS